MPFSRITPVFFMICVVALAVRCRHPEPAPIGCAGAIRVGFYDAASKRLLERFEVYDVTSCPEGMGSRLEQVSRAYVYQDSAGFVCLPVYLSKGRKLNRRLILVKEGYSTNDIEMALSVSDTLLPATPIRPNP